MTEELEEARRLLRAQPAVYAPMVEFAPPQEVFTRVIAAVCGALDWSFGAIWRPSPSGSELHCGAAWAVPGPGRDDFERQTAERVFGQGEGLPGRAWTAHGAVWLADAGRDPSCARAELARRAGLHAQVAFPLVLGEAFEGVMEVFADEPREPSDQLLAWFSNMGVQLGQYLDRWRTHEALLRRDRALAATLNGVVIADATRPGFPLVYANPGFERLTGYAAHEVIGRPCSVLQGAETDADAVREIAEALAGEHEYRGTVLNYRRDGTPFWNEVFLSPVRDPDGRVTQVVGVQTDVTERRRVEERVAWLAYHDSLTGLANRALLARHVERAVERAEAHGFEIALLYLDVDNFKRVNDALGHAAGDELLGRVAERLRAVVGAGELLVRQGGDEFLVLIDDVEGDALARATRTAEDIALALHEPFDLAGTVQRVRGSIGISVFGRDAHSADALLRHADMAMYRAKRAGGGFRAYSGRRGADEPPAARAAAGADLRALGPEERAELERMLVPGGVRAAYQPIVELDSGAVVGYEALARGPEGSVLERPDLMFDAGRRGGRLVDLDWACRAAAFAGALEGDLDPRVALFVNVEPDALDAPCPDHFARLEERAGERLRVTVEITERALTARPAELLHAIARMRRAGRGIALDDVGADTRSLALMPLLRPDVIKLDLRLVQAQPSTEIAEIVNAVNAERERTGAVVLAEGIETEAHLVTARALGATLGQGWLFGRPGPLPLAGARGPAAEGALGWAERPAEVPGRTPYDAVRGVRETRLADKRLLLSISLRLEQQAAALGETAVILSAFQSAERFTPATNRRYTVLAADAAFVGALGVGMEGEPAPGVRGAALDPDDPLLGEWSVVVLGPHFAAALVAQDLGDEGPEMERRFEFALTYDRELVIEAANTLMRRVLPLGVVPAAVGAH